MVSLLTVRTRLYGVEPINYNFPNIFSCSIFWLLISYISINYSYIEKIEFISILWEGHAIWVCNVKTMRDFFFSTLLRLACSENLYISFKWIFIDIYRILSYSIWKDKLVRILLLLQNSRNSGKIFLWFWKDASPICLNYNYPVLPFLPEVSLYQLHREFLSWALATAWYNYVWRYTKAGRQPELSLS